MERGLEGPPPQPGCHPLPRPLPALCTYAVLSACDDHTLRPLGRQGRASRTGSTPHQPAFQFLKSPPSEPRDAPQAAPSVLTPLADSPLLFKPDLSHHFLRKTSLLCHSRLGHPVSCSALTFNSMVVHKIKIIFLYFCFPHHTISMRAEVTAVSCC